MLKTSSKTHVLKHSGRKDFQNDVCGKEFTQNVNLITHLLSHNKGKYHKCNVCKREFSLKSN